MAGPFWQYDSDNTLLAFRKLHASPNCLFVYLFFHLFIYLFLFVFFSFIYLYVFLYSFIYFYLFIFFYYFLNYSFILFIFIYLFYLYIYIYIYLFFYLIYFPARKFFFMCLVPVPACWKNHHIRNARRCHGAERRLNSKLRAVFWLGNKVGLLYPPKLWKQTLIQKQ